MSTQDNYSIPVIDIGKITSAEATEEDFKSVGRNLVDALQKCGFLYLLNHGFSKSLLQQLDSNATAFFSLDEKTKMKYRKDHEKKYLRGYMPKGRENLFEEMQQEVAKGKVEGRINPKESYRETYDHNGLDEKDVPNVEEVPGLKRAVEDFCKNARKAAEKILRALEYGLDFPTGSLLNIHRNLISSGLRNCSTGRLLCYPAIAEDVSLPEGSLRCAPHTDYGTFTFLFQDSVGGLEIFNKNNEWQPARPMEGTVVFNIADNAETFTGGKLTATRHRVVIPRDTRQRSITRRSYTYFVHADNDVLVKPLFACGEEEPDPVTVFQYNLNRVTLSRKHLSAY